MPDDICKNCVLKDTKIGSLTEQITGLEKVKKTLSDNLETKTKENKEYSQQISDYQAKTLFTSLKGKAERYDDFKKLSDGNFADWSDLKKKEFSEKYEFLFDKPENPKSQSIADKADTGDAGGEQRKDLIGVDMSESERID